MVISDKVSPRSTSFIRFHSPPSMKARISSVLNKCMEGLEREEREGAVDNGKTR